MQQFDQNFPRERKRGNRLRRRVDESRLRVGDGSREALVPELLVEWARAAKSLFNSRVDWGGSSDFKGGLPVTFEVS
jgi:hypothetical protein